MSRPHRAVLTFAVALAANCAPAALPSSESRTAPTTPAATPASRTLATSDLVTIRQAGPATTLAVRSVATGAVEREIPDGVLLPDGKTLITLETGANSVTFTAVDRGTGARGRSTTVQSYWKLRPSWGGAGGLSGNGKWLGLIGSAFNFKDASGQWVAHSEFGVMDTGLTSPPRVIKLDGNYFLEAVSDDGRSVYLIENPPPDRPSAARLRVYDLTTGALADPAGDEVPSLSGFRTDLLRVGDAAYMLVTFGSDPPFLVRMELDKRRVKVARVPAERTPNGEAGLLWSMAMTRDATTLFVANPAAGVVNEIDPISLTVRRTGKVSTAPARGILATLSSWLRPIADAKIAIRAGAILSADERTLYVVGENAIKALDTGSLAPRPFDGSGQFVDLALSPDGLRLYALNAFGRWMSVFDARTGDRLAELDVGGFPQAIVAVDPR